MKFWKSKQMIKYPQATLKKVHPNKIDSLIQEEIKSSKEYAKMGYEDISRDEARHARILRKSKMNRGCYD